MVERYGVENSMQNHDIQAKAKSSYLYDSMYFKSSWELAFYIYCKDNDLDVAY